MAELTFVKTTRKKRVFEVLRDEITAGKWTPGNRLGSMTALAKRFDTSIFTIQQALNMLEEKGYITKRNGCGTFVAERAGELTLTGTVVLCMETGAHLFGDLYGMLLRELQTRGRSVLTVDTEHENSLPIPMLERALYSEAQIFVVHGCLRFPYEVLERKAAAGKTIIGVIDWETDKPIPNVHRILTDHVEGGRLVAQHLYENGHRRVLVAAPDDQIKGINATQPFRQRHGYGFRMEWERLGGILDILPTKQENAERDMVDEDTLFMMLDADYGPTAVFGLMDCTIRRLRMAISEKHPELLKRIEFIGYGDTPHSQLAEPPFSTVNWNLEEIAKRTCELIDSLGGEQGPVGITKVKPRLIIR